jgi:hypothetical protein
VCNATYCDDVPPLGTLTGDEAAVYVSSKAGKRFERTTLHWTHSETPRASNLDSDANKGAVYFNRRCSWGPKSAIPWQPSGTRVPTVPLFHFLCRDLGAEIQRNGRESSKKSKN